MVLLAIVELSIGIISIAVSFLLLVTAIRLKSFYKFRIMYIFAGLFFGFLFYAIGNMLGGLDYLIFILPGDFKPLYLCNTEGFLRFFGGFIEMIYQILTDLALYWNVFNFERYLAFVTYYIRRAQYIIFLIAIIIAIIPLLFDFYGPNNFFPEQSCYIDLSDQHSLNAYYNFIFIEIPSIFSFLLDILVITRIICFYMEYSKTAIERHYLLHFLCYPIIFLIIVIPQIILIILDITVKVRPSLSKNINHTFLVTIEAISLYLSILKPLIVGAVYGIQLPNFKHTYAYVEKQSLKEIEQTQNYINLGNDYERSI